MTKRSLTEGEQGMVLTALRLAAEMFVGCAAEMRTDGQERLAEQFARQAADASALADLFEGAASVLVAA